MSQGRLGRVFYLPRHHRVTTIGLFSAIVRDKKIDFRGTTRSVCASFPGSHHAISVPSIKMLPFCGSYERNKRLMKVVLRFPTGDKRAGYARRNNNFYFFERVMAVIMIRKGDIMNSTLCVSGGNICASDLSVTFTGSSRMINKRSTLVRLRRMRVKSAPRFEKRLIGHILQCHIKHELADGRRTVQENQALKDNTTTRPTAEMTVWIFSTFSHSRSAPYWMSRASKHKLFDEFPSRRFLLGKNFLTVRTLLATS